MYIRACNGAVACQVLSFLPAHSLTQPPSQHPPTSCTQHHHRSTPSHHRGRTEQTSSEQPAWTPHRRTSPHRCSPSLAVSAFCVRALKHHPPQGQTAFEPLPSRHDHAPSHPPPTTAPARRPRRESKDHHPHHRLRQILRLELQETPRAEQASSGDDRRKSLT
jgi:hypothetical protein